MNNLVNASVQKKWEWQAYGGYKDEILESVRDSLTYKLSGVEMVIASYLSDAQELIACGDSERARQYINIAKMLIFEKMDAKQA